MIYGKVKSDAERCRMIFGTLENDAKRCRNFLTIIMIRNMIINEVNNFCNKCTCFIDKPRSWFVTKWNEWIVLLNLTCDFSVKNFCITLHRFSVCQKSFCIALHHFPPYHKSKVIKRHCIYYHIFTCIQSKIIHEKSKKSKWCKNAEFLGTRLI